MEVKNPQEIPVRLKKEKDAVVKERLIFLNLIANHRMSIREATQAVGIAPLHRLQVVEEVE